MKLILSRKGFDSGYGQIPSPILPKCRTLLSLPIPDDKAKTTYEDIKFNVEGNEKTYKEILKELNPNIEYNKCHLDPDIRDNIRKNPVPNWEALFGQEGPALSHLNNQGIKENDIFLFFGWFKDTEMVDGKLQYKKNAADLHVIYGYLQVGKKYDTYDEIKEKFPWHPHADDYEKDRELNAVYSATKHLSFMEEYPGYGTFKFNDKLILTKKDLSRSRWQLPECLNYKKITYHSKNSYKSDYFQSARIGQEFVVVDDIDKDIINWIKGLFESQKDKS